MYWIVQTVVIYVEVIQKRLIHHETLKDKTCTWLLKVEWSFVSTSTFGKTRSFRMRFMVTASPGQPGSVKDWSPHEKSLHTPCTSTKCHVISDHPKMKRWRKNPSMGDVHPLLYFVRNSHRLCTTEWLLLEMRISFFILNDQFSRSITTELSFSHWP
jgi:hypothetical protein